jgi:hypothetical protein
MAGDGKLQVRHAGGPVAASSTATPPATRRRDLSTQDSWSRIRTYSVHPNTEPAGERNRIRVSASR